MIKSLPAAHQPLFTKTIEVEKASRKAHMEAKLKMLKSVRATLEYTKRFLDSRATEEEEAKIAEVLMFFDRMDGPGERPGGHGMGGPPPGGKGAPGQADAEDLVLRMIQETDQKIERIKKMIIDPQYRPAPQQPK
jgi:hypothetical protein